MGEQVDAGSIKWTGKIRPVRVGMSNLRFAIPRGFAASQSFQTSDIASKLAIAVRKSWPLLSSYGGVAQLGEHLPCKQGVMSSNLTISTVAMSHA